MEKIVLDTDIGSDIDDAVCLAYLLRQKECELLGVTTVTGEPESRASLVDAICRAEGRTDIPVHSGAAEPLLIPQRQQTVPQAKVLKNLEHREHFEPNTAVPFLREMIHAHPGEITLLTIGPLTNIGLLFALDREVPGLLKALVMMVGQFFSEPAARTSEWNAKGDAHSTAVVFGANVENVTAIGLDVTRQCTLPKTELQRQFNDPMLQIVSDMSAAWLRDTVTFHDPLAASVIFKPELCRYESGSVEVVLESGEDQGKTFLTQSGTGRVKAASEVDAKAFFTHYFETVHSE